MPNKPDSKEFENVVKVLKDHLRPERDTYYERFVFNKRTQKEGRGVSDFAVQIRKLSSSCNFDSFLEKALRNKLLWPLV